MLDKKIVEDIKEFIEKKKEEHSINNLYPNIIIKSDVLQILDRFCTIIYYPLPEGEGNNGFHVNAIPGRDGEDYHFVFINTHQTMDKQVFTAAHELGHVWKVEEYICKLHKECDTDQVREEIVNRFAAELLMPEKEFSEQYLVKIRDLGTDGNKISFDNFIKLVSSLMYIFLSPLKAVLRRLSELGFLSVETTEILFSEERANLGKVIKQAIERTVKKEGYIELYKPTEKKYIDGLVELLEAAEENKLVSAEKIQHMRELFDISIEAKGMEDNQRIDYIQLESETNR